VDGAPGSGKMSLIKAFANDTNRRVILFTESAKSIDSNEEDSTLPRDLNNLVQFI
jgi:hypothetical protein